MGVVFFAKGGFYIVFSVVRDGDVKNRAFGVWEHSVADAVAEDDHRSFIIARWYNEGMDDLSELEELGVMDGQQDAISGSFYTGFGMSVDYDNLTDEEQEAYEMGYHTGYGAGGGWENG